MNFFVVLTTVLPFWRSVIFAVKLRWLPVQTGHCPDCDDNALEPTTKGEKFPTGQAHPPAHPGCRCFLVPFDAADAARRGGDREPVDASA